MKQPVNVTSQFEQLTHISPLVLEAVAKVLNLEEVTADQVAPSLIETEGETLYDLYIGDQVVNVRFALCGTACHVTKYEGGQVKKCLTVGRSYPLWKSGKLNNVREFYDSGVEILTYLTDKEYLKYSHDQDLDLLAEHGVNFSDYDCTDLSQYQALEAKLKELRNIK